MRAEGRPNRQAAVRILEALPGLKYHPLRRTPV
ncbi:hypothetical protein ABIA32_001738 [Streptacidiphilus sp. MAP12-20]